MCSAARGLLISERNHTSALFHASVAADTFTHTRTRTYTLSNKCKHAWTDVYKTKKRLYETLCGREARQLMQARKILWVVTVRMKGYIWSFKNNHNMLCGALLIGPTECNKWSSNLTNCDLNLKVAPVALQKKQWLWPVSCMFTWRQTPAGSSKVKSCFLVWNISATYVH